MKQEEKAKYLIEKIQDVKNRIHTGRAHLHELINVWNSAKCHYNSLKDGCGVNLGKQNIEGINLSWCGCFDEILMNSIYCEDCKKAIGKYGNLFDKEIIQNYKGVCKDEKE